MPFRWRVQYTREKRGRNSFFPIDWRGRMVAVGCCHITDAQERAPSLKKEKKELRPLFVTRFDDFEIDAVTLARRLLGQRFVRQLNGERLSGRIVEVEAYLGQEDRASHTSGGRRTKRNESMYLDGGHAYVYHTYGMHFCMNVVAGKRDEGTAVLIRALEPEEGLHAMEALRQRGPGLRQLCSGPGKLTQAMGIDRALDGVDMRSSKEIWIERLRARAMRESQIEITPRIGVGYAGEWAKKPMRFLVSGSAYASRR